ncbi:MAG: TlyA family RNA methyltransferase [Bacteriovoracaceae bacterium]|jgi:23S rRNA (cytidine1920-2'-O)/16S rRNA (cytidine1409-2'-O)-methyltransferase|nr:TlyA family RNA methyltransferase [Bacteriovoracaceae bacterium]
MRLDKALVDIGLIKTRAAAKVQIQKENVLVNNKVVTKPSFEVSQDDEIKLKDEKVYVSRGAYKLVHALNEFNLNVKDLVAADIGASTGGFTQVLLEAGAVKVFCIDVGFDQLADSLKNDERVINIEKTNIKNEVNLNELVDIFVCDVSFISLKLIFKNMASLLKPSGVGVVLIKPQFEAGKDRIRKDGSVSDSDRKIILEEMNIWFKQNNFMIKEIIESPIKGNKSLNTEYLALYIKD